MNINSQPKNIVKTLTQVGLKAVEQSQIVTNYQEVFDSLGEDFVQMAGVISALKQQQNA